MNDIVKKALKYYEINMLNNKDLEDLNILYNVFRSFHTVRDEELYEACLIFAKIVEEVQIKLKNDKKDKICENNIKLLAKSTFNCIKYSQWHKDKLKELKIKTPKEVNNYFDVEYDQYGYIDISCSNFAYNGDYPEYIWEILPSNILWKENKRNLTGRGCSNVTWLVRFLHNGDWFVINNINLNEVEIFGSNINEKIKFSLKDSKLEDRLSKICNDNEFWELIQIRNSRLNFMKSKKPIEKLRQLACC